MLIRIPWKCCVKTEHKICKFFGNANPNLNDHGRAKWMHTRCNNKYILMHRSNTPFSSIDHTRNNKKPTKNKQATNKHLKSRKGIKHATATTDTKNKTRKLWTQTNNSRKKKHVCFEHWLYRFLYVLHFCFFFFHDYDLIVLWFAFSSLLCSVVVVFLNCWARVFGVLSLASSVLPVRPSCASMIIIMMMKLKQHSTN